MQLFTTCFLALYLAHLLTDFVLQSDRMVAQKKAGAVPAYARHGGIHALACTLIMWLALPDVASRSIFYAIMAGLTLAHLAIDGAKSQLVRSGGIDDDAKALLCDQLLHLLTVGAASWLLAATPLLDLISRVRAYQSQMEKLLLLLVVYVGIIFGGGYVVRFLTKALGQGALCASDVTRDELQNAGMYIGWLERFLVLTALLLQSPATVGLIFTAKSIARYSELKSVRFAEYFLIGTLLSVSIGIIGGLILLRTFYGSVALVR